jgi:hypothetical protein
MSLSRQCAARGAPRGFASMTVSPCSTWASTWGRPWAVVFMAAAGKFEASTIASAVGLIKAAGIRPLTRPSTSIATWVSFCVCAYGLQQLYEILFDLIATIEAGKRRSL